LLKVGSSLSTFFKYRQILSGIYKGQGKKLHFTSLRATRRPLQTTLLKKVSKSGGPRDSERWEILEDNPSRQQRPISHRSALPLGCQLGCSCWQSHFAAITAPSVRLSPPTFLLLPIRNMSSAELQTAECTLKPHPTHFKCCALPVMAYNQLSVVLFKHPHALQRIFFRAEVKIEQVAVILLGFNGTIAALSSWYRVSRPSVHTF
jgi:hypothetical protein